MNLSISCPFLASEHEQIPMPETLGNIAVEATCFYPSVFEKATWGAVWTNIESAISLYGEQNVTFHFPIYGADYVNDTLARQRLVDAYARSRDLGIAGVVVHSNQVRSIREWRGLNIQDERERLVSTLNDIVQMRSSGLTWLAIENMPLMDNVGKEIDPLLCYPEDFTDLIASPVGIVWDVSHFLQTCAYTDAALSGHHDSTNYPTLRPTDSSKFKGLANYVTHWHFSGFRGLARPRASSSVCVEGVQPWNSTMPEQHYKDALLTINESAANHRIMVLEISELDYRSRIEFPLTVSWIRKSISANSNKLQ